MERRNERQKGFTLVECIAVLVVLAVLATFLVPALTRYLDEGREKQAVSEAQICVTSATEWAATQRTALVAKAYAANKDFKDAYADADNAALRWSAAYADLAAAAPTVTGGTVALTEGDGQYVLRPDTPAPNGTANDAMRAAVTTAAEVDGHVTAMQLNADGKVLYLLYTAKNGTTVAYTAADTAQDPATTVLVAKLPENKTPTPPTPSHSGDLVFRVLDEYSNQPVSGIRFHVEDLDGTTVFDSRTTDAKGMVYFTLDPATLTSNFQQFKLVPEDWPEGYQQVFDVQFNIVASDKNNDGSYDSYEMQANPVNKNHTYDYKEGAVGTLTGGAENHLYTFYVRPVPTLELCVWDDVNKILVENVKFTLSNGTKPQAITSGSSPTMLDVKLHTGDNLRPGRETNYLDMCGKFQNGNNANLLVECSFVPKGYQYFDKCNIQIQLRNENGHNSQLYTEFQTGQQFDGKTSNTVITCDNQFKANKCIVTIHVIPAATVTIQKTNDLGQPVPDAELKLETLDASNNRNTVAQWTTDTSGAKTFTLTAGTYYLKEEKAPTDYTPAKELTFTVPDNNPLTVELVNHKIDEDDDDVTITDSVTITFEDAENWAYKLTSDEKIKFNHEILFWKGKYYYAIPKTEKRANPYKKQWDDKKLDLNADITPNPQQWFKDNVGDKLSPYVITLTGKIWTQSDLKNKVSAENPLQCGDLYWYKNGKNSKLYLYYGEKITDKNDKVITDAIGNKSPDSTKGDTANDIKGNVWASIDEGKYKIDN